MMVAPQGPQPVLMLAGATESATVQASRTLREALLPSEREWAAEQLGKCDWHSEPEAVEALLMAARSDPAPMVRVACVHALGRMKVNTLPVIQTLQGLKADADLRVRNEVEQVMPMLTGK
jgi:hypothetical protein